MLTANEMTANEMAADEMSGDESAAAAWPLDEVKSGSHGQPPSARSWLSWQRGKGMPNRFSKLMAIVLLQCVAQVVPPFRSELPAPSIYTIQLKMGQSVRRHALSSGYET